MLPCRFCRQDAPQSPQDARGQVLRCDVPLRRRGRLQGPCERVLGQVRAIRGTAYVVVDMQVEEVEG